MKREVTWPGTRSYLGEWRLIDSDGSCGGIEPVDQQLIKAKIRSYHIAIVRRRIDGVRVRSALPLWVRYRS